MTMATPIARTLPCILLAVTPPLDSRVDPKRITTLPAPTVSTVADVVRAPALAPVHRIADSAAKVPVDADTYALARKAIESGLRHLSRTQTSRGTWFEAEEVAPTDLEPRRRSASVAVTAMALKAYLQAGELGSADSTKRARGAIERTLSDEAAMQAVATGGIGNYAMSAIASGLAAADDAAARIGRDRAIRWLTDSQWDETEGLEPTTDWYGGAGYGNGKRPDLSNTQMMVDAMHDAGMSPDEPAMQRALAFVARTQNRKATNPAAWAQDGSGDGGFVYSPANGGESFASDAAGEGRYGEKLATKSLRSYGSMTYAGFKSMLYAGLSKDDPRVKDALAWISLHFTFDENPGLGQQGYFYYVHAMSRALHAARMDSLRDANGVERAWRRELVAALAARQREDGSWRNSAERWEESNEDLATIYAVLALEEALKPSSTRE
jgi:squalene-hopene/tetraprenyl-beta-curcumene cyclase